MPACLHDAAMDAAENLLSYQRGPMGWIIVAQTETSLELRDPQLSLLGALTSGWKLLLTAMANIALAAFCFFVAAPLLIFQAIGVFSLLLAPLCFHCIWQRWRTPCHLRIADGVLSLLCRRGSLTMRYEWDVRDVIEVETSHGSSTFHSHYSLRLHLSDGTRIPFFHCRDGFEGQWIVQLIKMTLANELAALEGAIPLPRPASLPPPALADALRHRVADIDDQIIKTVPPALPGSQTASTSNRNKA